ncbi:MAG TPA: TraB domain-containing protein [Limnochordia bacterium]|nr:TraB domain-containing protein [Limnochordia bacterium]HXK97656.1 TraB domain-containing protein [Limnochordia bacterium]
MEECITRLHLDGKELILIGTIHMSKRSVEQVKAVIETERPETVCVELDDLRSVALAKASTEADAVPADGELPFLLLNTIIATLQKRLALDWGLLPGQDLLQAVKSAKAIGAQLILADCNIQAAFCRIWESISLMEKAKLLARFLIKSRLVCKFLSYQ